MPANNYYDSLFSKAHVDLNRPRSALPRERKVYTSFDAGKLIPLAFEEVLPGDTVIRKSRNLWRLSTPKFPTMDHAFLDIYNFFVPYRILQTNFKRVFGESDDPWLQNREYFIPQVKFFYDPFTNPTNARGVGSFTVGDYFGLPTEEQIASVNTGRVEYSVSALNGRAYAMIWNEFFRDVNLMKAADCPLGDTDTLYYRSYDTADPITVAAAYGALLPVSRVHDYFSSCLPSPQRGEDVALTLGGNAPVKTSSEPFALADLNNTALQFYNGGSKNNRLILSQAYDVTQNIPGSYAILGRREHADPNTGASSFSLKGSQYTINDSSVLQDASVGTGVNDIVPSNLYADLSAVAMTTINDLRKAIATQQYLELLARGGNRYRSFLHAFFGVTSPDASLQIPQYLNGKRIPIKISQVIQNSSDNQETSQPLGETGAYSLTYDEHFDFENSFTEYGVLITLGCLRTTHTYTQGLHKSWKRKTALDFYTPIFANLGEMPVDKGEIVFTGDTDRDSQVFGYQEAYAEYRYSPNIGTGRFRAGTPFGTYLPWTYIDDYDTVPALSSEWISEPKELLNRSLVVNSEQGSQIFGEIHFDDVWRRVMPVYSIPGLYRL